MASVWCIKWKENIGSKNKCICKNKQKKKKEGKERLYRLQWMHNYSNMGYAGNLQCMTCQDCAVVCPSLQPTILSQCSWPQCLLYRDIFCQGFTWELGRVQHYCVNCSFCSLLAQQGLLPMSVVHRCYGCIHYIKEELWLLKFLWFQFCWLLSSAHFHWSRGDINHRAKNHIKPLAEGKFADKLS